MSAPPVEVQAGLPAEMLADAAQLRDGLAAVLDLREVADADVVDVMGPLDAVAVQLTALSWRRRGLLAPDGKTPRVGPTVISRKLDKANFAAILAQVRQQHPDLVVVHGVASWTYTDDAGRRYREVATLGDFVVRDVSGVERVVHPEEG